MYIYIYMCVYTVDIYNYLFPDVLRVTGAAAPVTPDVSEQDCTSRGSALRSYPGSTFTACRSTPVYHCIVCENPSFHDKTS